MPQFSILFRIGNEQLAAQTHPWKTRLGVHFPHGDNPNAMEVPVVSSRSGVRALLGGIALFLAASLPALSDDRQDSPDLQNTFVVGQVDLAGLYVFRSPTNADNTVFVLLAGPHAQVISRPFFDPKARYEFKIDSTEDFKPDLTFRIRFGQPDANGTQTLKLQRMIGRKPFTTIASGNTGANLAIEGGGIVRAGVFDDPFFFDAFAFNDLVADGVGNFPRVAARNFYGPNANILGIVVEVPSVGLVKEGQTANDTIIDVWGRVLKNGIQIDRVGRPMTNIQLIPPVPRNAQTTDLRRRFNRGQPKSDKRVFGPATQGILQNFFGRTESDATALTNLFMPDVLFFQIGNPNGFGTFVNNPDQGLGTVFGNGRRLRDDAIDNLLTIFTNGALTTDNVPDDNGTRITDGNMGTIAAFPYLGPPNFFVSGPNP
jgi:hypothetical protein